MSTGAVGVGGGVGVGVGVHCEKGGEFATRLTSMLNAALARSDADGIGRKAIARKLGVEIRTVHTWTAPSHATAITSARLLELLVREDVLSLEARKQLLGDIARLAGFTVCHDADEDRQDLAVQVTEVTAALGKVADEVRISTTDQGERGRLLSRDEAIRIDEAAAEVVEQASQIRRAVMAGMEKRR